jgi:polysaccharide pyruvyl transferase WcaK-like protein
VLETECGARLLKGLIGRSAFLVAERIHSIIGATGVTTPFMCLGSRKDVRVSGIVEQMLDLSEAVYYLHDPQPSDLYARFDVLWSERARLKDHLLKKRAECLGAIERASHRIRANLPPGTVR